MNFDYLIFPSCCFSVICGFIFGPKLEKWLERKISNFRNKNNQ